MNPQFKHWIYSLGREIAIEVFSLPMIIEVYILLKIYKVMSLGPALFGDHYLKPNISGYDALRGIWSYELWPLVKWIPIAVFANALIKQAFRKENS